MANSKQTTDHKTIKNWIEKHDGVPAVIDNDGKTKVLRVHFPNASSDDEQFDEVSYEEFFGIFEDSKLAFLHSTDDDSTFNKFVSRD
jgi:hypothetical protein